MKDCLFFRRTVTVLEHGCLKKKNGKEYNKLAQRRHWRYIFRLPTTVPFCRGTGHVGSSVFRVSNRANRVRSHGDDGGSEINQS